MQNINLVPVVRNTTKMQYFMLIIKNKVFIPLLLSFYEYIRKIKT